MDERFISKALAGIFRARVLSARRKGGPATPESAGAAGERQQNWWSGGATKLRGKTVREKNYFLFTGSVSSQQVIAMSTAMNGIQ